MENNTIEESVVTKEMRPKVGLGIVCYTTATKEVLIGERIKNVIGIHQFPGGHIEYNETFEKCAQRELEEETGIKAPIDEFKHVTTLNVRRPDAKYHYIVIIMSVKVDKEVKVQNLEPDKNKGWSWIKYNELLEKEDLFYPIEVLKEQGFTKIEHFY